VFIIVIIIIIVVVIFIILMANIVSNSKTIRRDESKGLEAAA
jgi:hypothetical protein